MSRKVWSALLLSAATTIAATAVAGPAAASSYGRVTAGATTVSFSADTKVKNKVVITRSGRTVTIDDRVAVKPGRNCKQVKGDKTRVRCRTTKTPAKVIVYLYDRDDSVVNKERPQVGGVRRRGQRQARRRPEGRCPARRGPL